MEEKTLARLKKKICFIKENKKLFEQYSMIKGYPPCKNPVVKEISDKARVGVGYSEKTVSSDIARSLYRLYKNIIANIKI